jgi:lysophospholipase L1-like esterase
MDMRIGKVLLLVSLSLALGGCATGEHWHTAWSMSHNAREAMPAMSGRTVRLILSPSISGEAVRVKIENTMGESPVTFSSASIGAAAVGPAIKEGTLRRLTFNGAPSLTLAPGAGAYSDPVALAVRAREKIALSLDVKEAGDISMHHVGLRTNWSAPGARAMEPSGAGFEPLPEIPLLNTGNWPYYWVAALDVQSREASGTIVLFGDSITDGRCSTRDGEGKAHPNLDQRWGDVLSTRLAARPSHRPQAIAIEAISGNALLTVRNGPPGLVRLDRDVLDRAGLTHVVMFIGTNDIAGGATAEKIIEGMQQAAARVRARGAKIIGVTAIPRGRPAPQAGWSAAQEAHRVALNEWIRKAPFDGVIDFDSLMKSGPVVKMADGSEAPSIPAAWNCDFTHPNAAGYKAMGEFVDLSLFDTKPR